MLGPSVFRDSQVEKLSFEIQNGLFRTDFKCETISKYILDLVRVANAQSIFFHFSLFHFLSIFEVENTQSICEGKRKNNGVENGKKRFTGALAAEGHTCPGTCRAQMCPNR